MTNLTTQRHKRLLEATIFALYFLKEKSIRSIPLIISIILLPLFSFGQSLRVSPLKPKPGDTLHIQYDPKGGKFEYDTLKIATAVVFEGLMQENKKITLTKRGNLYAGELATDSATQFVVLAFSTNKVWDSPCKEGHFFPFYKNGKPVEGALYLMANWYVNEDAKMLFNYSPDYGKAISLLKQELESYPEGKSVINVTKSYYESYYKLDSVKGKTAILEYIEKLTKQSKVSDKEYYVINRLYEALNMTAQAENALNALTKNYPSSPVIFVKRYKDAITPQVAEQMQILVLKLVKDYNMVAGTEFYSFVNSLNYALSEAYIKEYNLPKYTYYLEKLNSSILQAASLISSASLLTDQNKELPEAEKMTIRALGLLDTLSSDKSNDNLAKRINALQIDCIGTLGKLYYQEKRFDEAYKLLKKSYDDGNDSDQINRYYGLLLVKFKKYELANKLLNAAIRGGTTENEVISAYREAYVETHTDDFQSHIKVLLEAATANQIVALKKKMINKHAPEFTLQDNLGRKVSLADYRGKIVVLDFWATWCIPCLQAFPGMQQVMNKYKDDPGVVFLFINTAETFTNERTKNINSYLKKNKFDIRVLMDEKSAATANKYELQTKYDASSIPLKVFIDQNGNIRFRSVGFPGSDELVMHEISSFIDILKNP